MPTLVVRGITCVPSTDFRKAFSRAQTKVVEGLRAA